MKTDEAVKMARLAERIREIAALEADSDLGGSMKLAGAEKRRILEIAADALENQTLAMQSIEGWRPIESAPKDGTIIWACFHPRIYPDIRPGREDLERWNGVQVPLRHPGIYDGYDDKPFDMGWNVAAPVGNGGFPDDWIVGWMPLPAPPLEMKP